MPAELLLLKEPIRQRLGLNVSASPSSSLPRRAEPVALEDGVCAGWCHVLLSRALVNPFP